MKFSEFFQQIFSTNFYLLTIASFRIGVPSILFNLKMPLLSTHFISIFTRSCQIHCFLHTVPAIQQSWKFRVSIWQKFYSKISTSWNCRHSVQKAVDLTTPGKNRDKMSGKKWHFQIKKMIVFFRKLTWYWQLTSTTRTLPQCALCSTNI